MSNYDSNDNFVTLVFVALTTSHIRGLIRAQDQDKLEAIVLAGQVSSGARKLQLDKPVTGLSSCRRISCVTSYQVTSGVFSHRV